MKDNKVGNDCEYDRFNSGAGAVVSADSIDMLVSNEKDIFYNADVIDNYLNGNDSKEKDFAIELIKKGACFLMLTRDNKTRFYPSRFIGYKFNSMAKHERNNKKDGKLTNPRISSIFKQKLVEDDECEKEFYAWCSDLGITPYNKKHKFWNVSGLDRSK